MRVSPLNQQRENMPISPEVPKAFKEKLKALDPNLVAVFKWKPLGFTTPHWEIHECSLTKGKYDPMLGLISYLFTVKNDDGSFRPLDDRVITLLKRIHAVRDRQEIRREFEMEAEAARTSKDNSIRDFYNDFSKIFHKYHKRALAEMSIEDRQRVNAEFNKPFPKDEIVTAEEIHR